jgi:hypothetical protein
MRQVPVLARDDRWLLLIEDRCVCHVALRVAPRVYGVFGVPYGGRGMCMRNRHVNGVVVQAHVATHEGTHIQTYTMGVCAPSACALRCLGAPAIAQIKWVHLESMDKCMR